jgi:hypothetical protein
VFELSNVVGVGRKLRNIADVLHSVSAGPFGAETVRDRVELGLENGLEQMQDRGLDHAIRDGRDTERPGLSRLTAFGDQHAANW